MRRFRLLLTVFLVPALAYLVATLGCSSGGDGKDKPAPKPTKEESTQSGGGDEDEKTPLDVKAYGTLKGMVKYDGDAPKPGTVEERDDFKKNADKDKCKAGDVTTQQWKVAADGGVSNVVVFLLPPKNKYFPIPPADKKTWKDTVDLSQPVCAFEPHVLWTYPQDATGKKTGQKFEVVNNANFPHNTKWSDAGRKSDNKLLAPGDKLPRVFVPSRTPIEFQCSIHSWMNAYGWVFDHPYVDISKDGKFEIKNVPAGVKLRVVAWHEDANGGKKYILPESNPSSEGQEMEFKPDDSNVLNFKVKK